MINLDAVSLSIIKSIFKKHLDGVEVRAFGSRVNGNATPFSDLDLVLMSQEPVPLPILNALKFDLSNSDLAIMVDVVDWHAVSGEFQQIISTQSVPFLNSF